MNLTLNFKQLNKSNADIAGGKGASLGEMTQAGIPVPPGFVVLSSTFDEFIKEANLVHEIESILAGVDHKSIHTVDQASEHIQTLIKQSAMPESIATEIKKQFKELDTEFVAVRSSATAEDGADNAWAGQLDSFLNTKEANLLEKVQHCWASLFTPRAIFYRFEKGLHTTKISVAVVVQKMVNSEISGIAFSVHPVTEDRNQMIIEAGFGLGEAIVSGQVTPDSYVVEKEPRRIIDTNVATQTRGLYRVSTGGNEWIDICEPQASSQVLTDTQTLEFADLIMRIENHYGFPCDIEWAFEKNKFYIVQSRPITTLQKVVTPTNESGVCVEGGELKSEIVVDEKNGIRLISKDPDIKKLKLAKIVRRNNSPLFNSIMRIGSTLNNPELDFDSRMAVHIVLDNDIYYCENDLKKLEDIILQKAQKDNTFFNRYFEKVEKDCLEFISWSKEQKNSDDLINVYDSFIEKSLKIMSHLWPCAAPEKWMLSQIEAELAKYIDPKVDFNLFKETIVLLTSPTKSSDMNLKKIDILEGKDLKEIYEKYAWSTDQTFSFKYQSFDEFNKDIPVIDNPKEELKKMNEGFKELAERQKDIIEKYKLNEKLVDLCKSAQMLPHIRLIRRDCIIEAGYNLKEVFYKIGKKIPLSDLALGYYWEIRDLLLDKKVDLELIEKRKETYSFVILDNEFYDLAPKRAKEIKDIVESSLSLGDEIVGQVACMGKVQGIARVLYSAKENYRIEQGNILVTSMTTPDFVPAMEKAIAFVTDEGGLSCHAAIIAREMKKPCVIGTKNATKLIKDGDLIEVDANTGKVKILQSAGTDAKKSLSVLGFTFKDASEYFTLGQWVSPTLEFEIWVDWCNTEGAKSFGLTQDDPASIVINGHYFMPKDGSYPKLVKMVSSEFESGDFKFTNKILSLAERMCNECLEMAEKVKSNPTQEDFTKAFDLMSKLRFPWFGCFPIGEAGEDYLKKYAKLNNVPIEDVGEMIPQLTNSLTDDQKELSRFKEIIENKKLSFDISELEKEDKDLAQKIKEYQKVTEYIGTHHLWGDERSIGRLMDAIKNASLESKNQKTESGVEAFNIIARATKWRLECAQSSALLAYKFRPYMTKLAEENGLKYDDLIYLISFEIKDLSKNKDEILAVIRERQKGLGFIKIKGQNHVAVGDELLEWEKYFGLLDKHEDVKEFKGSIGNKGIVRGLAVIVLKPSDQFKVQAGMILIAPETTPDYIPSMGKAAAFVTNQGGITSHAAIVAREMGKPCIIGTKIATKVIKDGDLIEVDANTGVVRIIK